MDNNSMGITGSPVNPSVTNRPEAITNKTEAISDAVSDTLSGKNVAAHIAVDKSAYVAEVDKVSLVNGVAETEVNAKIAADANIATDAKAEQTETEALEEVVSQLSEVMSLMNKGLAFSVDEDSGSAIVKVMDISSGEIIRQIPSDEALELAQKLQDVKGLLMRTEA
ncbi:flagellar protein FlaG [Shewanella sp. MEBiC00475]|uniref:flagellar protein FlaG n=1 Tax=Shewanella sp. MEBiC00475 TaxID=2575361 RepID=UPI0020C7D183|nr:flagellar protein FlaG [Shewanella sp. MEBiC00475]